MAQQNNDSSGPDFDLQSYQDDLGTGGQVDSATHAMTDEPSDYTGVPNKKLKPESPLTS